MEDLKAVFLIIFLTVLVVVVINYGIIRRFSGKKGSEVSYWSKALDAAKNPWQKEDEDMNELARLVRGAEVKGEGEKETADPNRQDK